MRDVRKKYFPMHLLRFPRITALGIVVFNILLLIWSTGDLERPFSWDMVRRYFNILVAIILAPSFALFFILSGIAKCRRSSIASITVWIILAAFVLTFLVTATTVQALSSTTAFAALFYFLGVGIQTALLLLLSYTWIREAFFQPKRL